MKPLVTAILLSWRRGANMARIVEAIRGQSVPVEIWLINNLDSNDYGADRLVCIPWNAGEWARYVFAGRIETPYGMFQDDDFMLGDSDFLADAIFIHDSMCPDHILGTAGRGLQLEPPYYRPDVTGRDGYVSIVKGHFQLFPASLPGRVRIPTHPSASDIYWSLDSGQGAAAHYVSAKLASRLTTLERWGVGYEFRPNHYQEREQVCAAWIEGGAGL